MGCGAPQRAGNATRSAYVYRAVLDSSNRRRRQPSPPARAARGARAPGEPASSTRAEFKRGRGQRRRRGAALQEDAGLDVVTDGEMRRLSFQSQLPAAVDGFGEWDLDAFLWGEWHSDELGDLTVERPPIARRRQAPAPPLALRRGARLRARPHRPRPQGHAAEPEPLRELLRPGALRATPTPRSRSSSATSPRSSARRSTSSSSSARPTSSSTRRTTRCSSTPATATFYESRGWPAERWLELGLELDNHRHRRPSRRDLRLPPLPRQPGEPLARRGRLRLARRAASSRRVNAQRLLLEYDDERSGGFEPLAQVPEDTIVRARARDDEDAAARDGRRARRPDPGGGAVRARSSASPSRRSAASPRRWSATRSPSRTSARSCATIAETAAEVWG